MKHLLKISLLVAIITAIFSCKKSDNPFVYPALQNTLWSGMFFFTSGDYTGMQPCTVTMLPDSTLKWTDAANQRPGGTWSTNNNKVTIIQPNKIAFSALFTADSWTNFSIPSSSGFLLDSLSKATPLQVSNLTGSTWFGQVNGATLKIQFTDGTKAQITVGTSVLAGTYSIDGGGVRLSYQPSFGSLSFGSFFAIANKDMTVLKGLEIFTSINILGGSKNYYYPFAVLKQ